jgi:hypothetical protein
MALYPPNNPQPPSRPPPDRPPPPPDWIPDWLKPFVPPPPPPIELDPPYDPPRPFLGACSPRQQNARRHAIRCQSSGSVAGLRSVPDAGLVLADGQLALLDSQRTRVTFPTPENGSSIRNSRQSMSSGGILELLAAATRVRQNSPRAVEFSARSQHPRWHDDADRPRSVTARQTAGGRGRRSLFQDCYLQ